MLGPEHCWRQSGGARAGVPGCAVGLRVVSWGAFSAQALWALSLVMGQVSSCSPASPPPQCTSFSAAFSCCPRLSCLSSPPSSWCPLHLSCFRGPGSTIWCQPSSASSQVWNRQAGLVLRQASALGRGWGGAQKQGDVWSLWCQERENFRGPSHLLFSEAAFPSPPGLQSLSPRLLSTLYFQLAPPSLCWLGVICLGVFLP